MSHRVKHHRKRGIPEKSQQRADEGTESFITKLVLTQWRQKCWPGRLVEGNGTNVELLDLIYCPNGQGAVVGQSQTVKETTMRETLQK